VSIDSFGGHCSRLSYRIVLAWVIATISCTAAIAQNQSAKPSESGVAKQPKADPVAKPDSSTKPGSAAKSDTATKPGNSAKTDSPVTPAAVVKSQPTKTFALSPISENSAPSGCGCFFYRPTDKRELGPLLLHMDNQGSATLRPEGQLVAMKLIDEQHSRRDPQTISAQDRVLLKMRGGATNASLSGIAERNCPKPAGSNNCSSVSYQSILTIDHGGKKSSQPAWGFCGCR
jgi:hypothetical protein